MWTINNSSVLIGSKTGDIVVEAGRAEEQLATSVKSTSSGFLSKTTTVSRHFHETTNAVASNVDGQAVSLIAQQGNISVKGSNVVAEQDLTLAAKENVSIVSDVNTHYQEDYSKTTKSGLMGSGGIGFTIGNKKETTEQDRTQESAASSQVGSLKGNTTIQAGNHYQQTGSIVTAQAGDVDIFAQTANITAARSDYESNYKYTYEQKGLTIALSTPALALAQAVASTYNAAKTVGKSKDDRINALAVANTAWSAYRLANSMPQPDLKNNIVADKNAQPSTTVGISITYGQQKNVSTTHTKGNTAQSSEINAGGKVNIVATGAGKQSDINIIGSDVSGKQGTSLKADNDINLLAAEQAHLERSTNKSSGFNAGVAIQIGSGISLGITAGGNYGKGYGNGDESTSIYSHVGDKNSQTTLESGATTNLKGAQVQGKGVKLDAQNLNIESLQETLTYKGKQMNVSGQVTAGYGFSASGSYNQSKMNADYASVVEQSGIYAGDDGYQVNVQNHTDLKGGLITSSQTAEDNGKNRFETGTLSYSDTSQTHTTSVNEQGYQRTDTTIGRKGLLHVKGEDGTLQIQAHNINLAGADIINDGQGQTYLSAKNNLNLTALSVGFDEKMGGGNHYRNEAVQSVEVSRVQGKGDVVLSGQNIYSEAAQLEAKQRLALLAENDVVLGSATTSSALTEYHHTKSGGAFGSSKKTTLDTYQDKTQVGTTLGGGEILVSASNDLKAKNLQAIADKDLSLQAVNNVSISADTNYFKDTHFEQKSKSGVFSGGGIGITFGKKSETHESEAEGWQQSQARSTLGSLSGNVSVKAGNHAHLSGTDLIASKELDKAITIEGKSTYIGASQDELSSKERHEYKQSGLTIAFSSAVTDAAMAVQSSLKRSEQVKDERLSQLLKVKAANEAAETVQKISQMIDAIQKAGSTSEALANSDAKVSVSVGASKSVSTSHTKQTSHQGSELSAGSVTVRATEGDNTLVGAKINAKEATLEGNNVTLLGTTDTQTNRSDNKSSSWSVGVFVGKSGGSTGLGIEGAASVGKGYANSDSQVQNHTEINADRLTIKANETTTLKGATANINHLALDTKNLHIESVQDVEKYNSKQTQGGVKAAFAWGSRASGSAQFSQNKANVDYAQVTQQSGFNIKESSTINVAENTHLKGGVINAQGDKANHKLTTGTLTTESIENHSDIKVSSISAGVSSDMTQMATSAMGAALSALGNTNESERSQTQAAISSNINVQITDSEAQKQKTGKTAEEALQSLNRDVANANQKLDKQDLTKAQERQESTQIVAEIGAKRVGDFAKYMGWEDGSPQKIALHGLIGYLSAKVGGGNTTASTLSAMGSEYINTEIANYLQENTALTADQRNAIQQASAAGLGALIGASLGGDSNTVNQSVQMAWRTEKFNRQLHPDEMKWIKAHAKEFAEQEGLTVEEAEKRLSQQAERDLDILWFLKLDSSTDDKAKAFLASQNNATFIDSKGDVQHYFVAKDNDFWTSRKYASDAYDYMQATGDNFYGRNLQTDTTVWEGTKDKLGKAYDHISENKLETAKAVGSAVIDSVVECGSDVTGCLGNFVAELWAKGTSSASEMGKNLVLSDQEKINALYGQDVEKEMVAVSSSQFIGTLTEALGIGKVAKIGGESVVDGMGTIVEKGLKSIDLQNLSRGATLKLPDGKYTYLGDGVFEGPDKGKIINTGKVDPATGNSIYQRINPNGSFSSSFLMISDDGTQIRTNKPKEDRLTIHQIEKNKLAGEQFEQEQYEKLVSEGYSPQKQVIVETPSGVRTILDFVIKENGIDICIECKSSATAPLTKNQKIAFPEIKEKGAIVISSDKEGYPKGTLIQPTEIKIERK